MGMIMPTLGMTQRTRHPKPKSLVDALFTKTQQRVLGALFGQPERTFYASELIRDAGTGSGAAQRELERLEVSGLLVSSRIGRQKHYQANSSSPIFAELRGIILKTAGLADPLREALRTKAPSIAAAFVFGSVANASDRADSDIDLMVVSDRLTYAEVFTALERASGRLGRRVNPTVYSTAEFAKRRRERNAFVAKVLAGPKFWIIGSEDDLPGRA